MTTTLRPVLTILIAGLCFQGVQRSVANSTPARSRGSSPFDHVEASLRQKKNLDLALKKITPLQKTDSICQTIEDAGRLLWQSINIANPHIRRVCTEYKGFFFFSRLDRAGQDDESFKSGIAVKKGTGEISRWDESNAQPRDRG